MEKLIIFGRVFSFTSKKTGDTYYTIEYICADSGQTKRDFISQSEYIAIKNQNLQAGTSLLAQLSVDNYDHIYVSSVSIL